MIFMPLVVFFVFFNATIKTTRIFKALCEPHTYNKCAKIFLTIVYLPWNLVILGLLLGLGTVGGILAIPIAIFPAYFHNIRRFRRTMAYWKGKGRFDAKVQAEKITF